MNTAGRMLLFSVVLVACGGTPPPPRAPTLPEDPITIAVHQRTKEAIPGSHGTLYVRLGDITVGQVMLSMENARGDTILDARSVRNDDVMAFQMGNKRHYLRVVRLYNHLFDEDLAELRISTAKPEPRLTDKKE